MQTLIGDYLTIAEAASQLHVAPSTIRRWIREGDLPAYRIGKRRLGVRKADLSAMISPADAGREWKDDADTGASLVVPKLTPEQKRRGLEAMERIKQLQKKIMEERGGVPFSPSWELINEARDERSRELAERS